MNSILFYLNPIKILLVIELLKINVTKAPCFILILYICWINPTANKKLIRPHPCSSL